MRVLDNRSFGALGEKAAAKYLKKNGYNVLEKNYKIITGEIDIIARKDDIITFVEVKTRSEAPMVSGVFAVNRKKQRNIMKTARTYLTEKNITLQPRFDILEVEIDRNKGKVLSYNHIKNAFIQDGDYAAF